MRRVLITGSRFLDDPTLVWEALGVELAEHGAPLIVVHGAAAGADAAADGWALNTDGAEPERHPANWSLGKFAGNIRNQEMVNLGADICLAFPAHGSRGTWDCIRRAEKAGIPVKMFHLDVEQQLRYPSIDRVIDPEYLGKAVAAQGELF